MKINLKEIINSKRGRYVFSILLGLGLATIFRQSCKSNNCLLFKAPTLDKIKNRTFSYNNKCYKFNEYAITCNRDSRVLLDIHKDDNMRKS